MRRSVARLVDIVVAIEAIDRHLTRGDLRDGLVFDAVRVRLIEIGETVKGIDAALLTTRSWRRRSTVTYPCSWKQSGD